MKASLRRLPEALVAVVFSALELREHCAFRHCARFFNDVARRPAASPHLLRIRAEPLSSALPIPPPPTTTMKRRLPEHPVGWNAKREADARARSPWDGHTRVALLETLLAVRGLRPRRVELDMRNLDGDAWLKLGDCKDVGGGGGSGSHSSRRDINDDDDDDDDGKKDERWATCLQHLTIKGWKCTDPLLATVLRFAPRLVSLEHAYNPPPQSSSLRSPSTLDDDDSFVLAATLVRLKIGVMRVEECRLLPATLSDLDVECPTATVERGDSRITARWTAAVAGRFTGLTRLRFGHVGAHNTYSLETLTESLPQLTDLAVPFCRIPSAPLGRSRLEKLACTFLPPIDAFPSSSSSSDTAPLIVSASSPSPTPLCRLGPALHTLDLASTMTAFGAPSFECALGLATGAPRLTTLLGLCVENDAEFERATNALSHAQIRTLGMCAPDVTSMAPLARFAGSLCALHIDRYHLLSRTLATVEPGDKSRAAVERVAEVVRRLWPPLPNLVRLALRDALDERDMCAVIERYPGVDAAWSWGADTHRHWSPADGLSASET